ncbi:TIGR04066 family peptide maturation system protein [Clostridium estertheticum]|uniref:TIGR04066 family peptide maturation system protein n=1 Tax=Clostridium estertheticum TaxID=238834 RepID=UPI001C0DF4E8|nr:TIGR04066 family peptide maturation system protein [Clostridium estertheticum]MBU3179107.1 TIGR04066 family peptide maturation system protein [Clostridium estertheticum]
MNNKYPTMIYPFDVESVTLIRHNKLINNYIITHAISPNGWGLVGKDVGDADNGQPMGIIVENDFDKALSNCDAVFFNTPSKKVDLDKVIYPKIIKAAKNSKHIICTIKIENRMIDEISHICHENNKSFEYFHDKFNKVITPLAEEIYQIDTPVIFVVGLAERTNKFEIQLNLRKYLKEMGYKVSQVGTRNYCELMGFYSFPQFMYSKSFTESEKVTLFNHYIKNISIMEKPDVIIIGIPGGTLPVNNKFTNKFGILAYEISRAVIPDVAVLSIPYGNIPLDFFESTSKSNKYKFGYSIDCYNIGNSAVNMQGGIVTDELQYITIDYNFINEKKNTYSSSGIPIYNILDSYDAKKMCGFLINNLQEYGDIKSI